VYPALLGAGDKNNNYNNNDVLSKFMAESYIYIEVKRSKMELSTY
jgi:hypothetical protein